MPAAAAPLTWSELQFLPEEAGEIELVFKARFRGDFLDREPRLGEQIARVHKSKFKQILVWTQPGVGGEGVAEPTVTYAEFLRQTLHVQIAAEITLQTPNRELNGVGILRFSGRLRLLRRVNEAHQNVGRAGEDLLERRAIPANRLHDPAERCQNGILGIQPHHGIAFGDEFVLKPAPRHRAIKTDPVFVPARFGVRRVTMPDVGKKQESMAGPD